MNWPVFWVGPLRHGRGQHTNCPAQQCITGLLVRPSAGVRRADEHGALDRRAGDVSHCRSGNGATMALGSRFFNRLPTKVVERIAPKPGTGPSERARENGHYTVETYTTTTTGVRYRATMSQTGRLRVQGHVGVAGGVRTGVGKRPRPALGSAWGPHARGSDGRCVASSIPRCRSVIGDNATELIRASRTPVDQDRLH